MIFFSCFFFFEKGRDCRVLIQRDDLDQCYMSNLLPYTAGVEADVGVREHSLDQSVINQ